MDMFGQKPRCLGQSVAPKQPPQFLDPRSHCPCYMADLGFTTNGSWSLTLKRRLLNWSPGSVALLFSIAFLWLCKLYLLCLTVGQTRCSDPFVSYILWQEWRRSEQTDQSRQVWSQEEMQFGRERTVLGHSPASNPGPTCDSGTKLARLAHPARLRHSAPLARDEQACSSRCRRVSVPAAALPWCLCEVACWLLFLANKWQASDSGNRQWPFKWGVQTRTSRPCSWHGKKRASCMFLRRRITPVSHKAARQHSPRLCVSV